MSKIVSSSILHRADRSRRSAFWKNSCGSQQLGTKNVEEWFNTTCHSSEIFKEDDWFACRERKSRHEDVFRSKSECVRRYTNQDVRVIFRFHQKETWTHTSRCGYSETASTERMLSRNEFLLCCQRCDVPLTRTTGTFLTGEESDFFIFEKMSFFSCFFYGVDGMLFFWKKWFFVYYFFW